MTDTGQPMSPVLTIEMDRLPESSLIVYFAVSKLKSGTVIKIRNAIARDDIVLPTANPQMTITR